MPVQLYYVWKVHREHDQNIMAAWSVAVSSNDLSLYRQCHPADGVFNPRDTLMVSYRIFRWGWGVGRGEGVRVNLMMKHHHA